MSDNFLTPQDRHDMDLDLIVTGLSEFRPFEIFRQVRTGDTVLGGVSITTTSIQVREMELQHLRGDEPLEVGGLRLEANYHGFCDPDVNLLEQDIITPDASATQYQILFLQNLWDDHIEFFAKRL